MAMKYNKALDLILAASVKAHAGNTVLAAKLMATAIREPDFARGMQILEASNANAEGAPVIETAAPKKAVKAAVAAPAAKPKVQARKATAAVEDEDDAEFDMGGDDADLEVLVGEGDDDNDGDEDEVDAGFEEDEEDEDDEDPVLDSAEFAAVLASMAPRRAAPKRR